MDNKTCTMGSHLGSARAWALVHVCTALKRCQGYLQCFCHACFFFLFETVRKLVLSGVISPFCMGEKRVVVFFSFSDACFSPVQRECIIPKRQTSRVCTLPTHGCTA